MRIIKVDHRGGISIYNENGRLHSFDGKPAYVAHTGGLDWYENGKAVKSIYPDGRVIVWRKVPK